jgi:hypothetical protein
MEATFGLGVNRERAKSSSCFVLVWQVDDRFGLYGNEVHVLTNAL